MWWLADWSMTIECSVPMHDQTAGKEESASHDALTVSASALLRLCLAVDTAIELAIECNASAVTIARCNHIGRLGEYVERLALKGMVGIAMCNTGAVVAPFGGRARMLGTNPFAFAAPAGESNPPIMIDFATASVAEGKLVLARAKNEVIPLGSIIDSAGHPSVDPDAFYAGGALLPFGGHKGYGMSVMVELLGGVLSGGGASS